MSPEDDDFLAGDLVEGLYAHIKTLNERLWEDHAKRPAVDRWLENFSHGGVSADTDRVHALYLLSRFMYFGDRELREMLRAVFRDRYRYPIIAELRRAANDTTDCPLLERLFQGELARTRFIGVGNPSESGTHLLYYFRQENELTSALFINAHEIFERHSAELRTIKFKDVTRYVFLDDFCGTGTQAKDHSDAVVLELKSLLDQAGLRAKICYYPLCATLDGLDYVRRNAAFDEAESIIELDASYKCFDAGSRYFRQAPGAIDQRLARYIALSYGGFLKPKHPLGFDLGPDGAQLLLGFHHNTPDGTLPIFWYKGDEHPEWEPIFRRYPKVAYSGSPGGST